MPEYSVFDYVYERKAESSVGPVISYDFFENAVKQGKRDEDSRTDYRASKAIFQIISLQDICARCGRNLSWVYVWNGERLCKRCMKLGQETWEPVSGEPAKVEIAIRIGPTKIVLEPPVSELLCFLEMKRDPLLESSLGGLGYRYQKPLNRFYSNELSST